MYIADHSHLVNIFTGKILRCFRFWPEAVLLKNEHGSVFVCTNKS